ncbi:MAG: hypothetical protein WCS99_00295 [Limisphaerales bacterium]
MNCKFLLALTVAVFALVAARAEPGASGEKLIQQEVRQEQIKATTARVGAQLGAVIGEYERNGLAGDDVVVLKSIRGVLDKLSVQDIARVVTLLQQARTASDADVSRRNALDAFSGQQNVTVQLRSLLLEYQRQQAMQEIASRMAALARRQGDNLKEAVGLATLTKGRDARRSETAHQVALQLQESEQGTIGDEAKIVLDRLQKVVQQMDGPAGERPRAALTRAGDSRLAATLDAASGDLKSSNLLSAAGNEKRARDVMQDIAKMLLPARDNLEVMKQALHDLEKVIPQQARAQAQASEAQRNKADIAEAERKQADVVDQTDAIREDLEKAAPKAGEELKAAVEKMQEARALLQEQPPRRAAKGTFPATEAQEEALVQMQSAKKSLEQAIAIAEVRQQQPKDKLTDLKELKKKVVEIAAQQEQVKVNSEKAEKAVPVEKKPGLLAEQAARQGAVKAETQQTQQDAAANAPEAAKTLGDAARQMEKSQQALKNKVSAPMAQQAAMDALDKAADQLDSQIAQLEKAKEDVAKLDQLSKEISKLLQGQQKVAMETAKAAERPDNKPAPQTAREQGELAQQTEATKSGAKELSPEAASELGAAKESMAAAKANLDKPDARKARPDQAQAMANLQAAKNAVEAKRQQLANELGQPLANDPAQLAKASETVAAAQQQVNQALAKLDQPAGLQEAVKQQQQQIAAALGEKAKALPQSKPVAEAKQAAERAVEKLGQNDLPAALGEMTQAQQGLQAAGKAEAEPPSSPQQPSLPQLAKQQAEVKSMTEALVAMQATQQAAQPLAAATEMIAPLTAGEAGPLPQMAEMALQKAQQALTHAAAQAGANKALPAKENAEAARQALAQAAAALALSQEGVGQQMAQDGKGQKGQGESQQKGKGQAKGPGESSPQASSKEGQGDGKKGNWSAEAGADGKTRGDVKGASGFLGLPARDRNALLQSQTERAPEEYSPLVEQYLKNLSDSASRGRKQ